MISIKNLIFTLFCFYFSSLNAQKSFIELRNSFWVGENITDLAFQRFFSDQVGLEVFLGGGNYGTRLYDNQTKNVFGNTYPLVSSYYFNTKEAFSYYKSSHKGFSLGLGLCLKKEIVRDLHINFTIGSGVSLIEETIEQDFLESQNQIKDTVFRKDHVNLFFCYNANFSYEIIDNIFVSVGASLPFTFILTNNYDDDFPTITDAIVLGFEPKMLIGLKYKLN